MVAREIEYILNSDPSSGSHSLSADGSSFKVRLLQPLNIPKDATNVRLECINSSIWYSFPNITTTSNKFTLSVGAGPDVTVAIPQGLYDLGSFISSVENLYKLQTTNDLPIKIVGNFNTQMIEFTLVDQNGADVTVDFTGNETVRETLGFDSGTVTVTSGQTTTGDNIAMFNAVNSLLMHCDLVEGLQYNGSPRGGIIAKIPINVRPGSQILYEPWRPSRCEANRLRGNLLNEFGIRVTNEKGESLNVAEPFTCHIRVSWEENV